MNKIMLMGRLTRDPEIRYTQGDEPVTVASFSLAVDKRYKRDPEEEADFFNCAAFGKRAEFIQKYFKKGMKAMVCGRMENNNYINKDGVKVYSSQVLLEEIDFVESKSARERREEMSQQELGPQEMNQEEELPFF